MFSVETYYNIHGEILDPESMYEVRSSDFLKSERNVNFDDFLIDADNRGFDITKNLNPHPNGDDTAWYVTTLLPKGTKLLRYGNEGGQYTAPIGTKYEELSLPYKEECLEYYEYEVIGSCEVCLCCIVQQGVVAPGFDMPGGGVQYYHSRAVIDLVKDKILRRVDINGRNTK